MKINLKTKIKALDGTTLKQDAKEGSIEPEIKNLFLIALQLEEAGDSMDDKRKLFLLMISLANAKDSIELQSEDVTILKAKSYKAFNSLVAGQLELILEGKEIPF